MFQESDHFAHSVAGAEILAQFVESTTEACRSFNGSKTAHRVVSLFDATVVLFQPIVEVFTRPMVYVTAYCLANCSWIGQMPIRCYLLGDMANHGNSLLEKSLGCLHLSLLASYGIHQIAIVVDRTIQIALLPTDFDGGFIDRPGGGGGEAPLGVP